MVLEQGTILGGKYVVDRLIGTGGMGSVWLCRHQTLGAPFALKLLRPELAHDADAMARFEREAKAAATLRTRHVVKVHDHGVDGERAYIVMELLDGEDLRTRMKRQGRLTRNETCRIIVQAARALHYAHAAGIIHRDLKPANIFIANIDGEEVVKILDFGIAKVAGTQKAGAATQTGALLGSPHYMSPEQIRGHWSIVDHRTDLWALGVVAFRALTGQLPFLGDVVGDVLVKVCIDPVPVPSTIAPDLTPEVDRFFERALARAKEQRFRSGLELATALAQALGQPLEAPDPSWITPLPDSSGSHLAVPEGPTLPTRPVGEAEGPLDLSSASTMPVTPRAAAVPDAPPASAGTLTDAGSLQVGPRGVELPRRYFAWVGVGVVTAALASAALVLTRNSEPEQDAATSLAAQPSEPAATEPQPEPEEPAPEPLPEQDTSATADVPTASVAPSVSASPTGVASGPAAKPPGATAPPTPHKPKDSFSDRFGYE